MDAIEQAIELIRGCEERLRTLVGEAAAVGYYESVMRLTSWAKSVAALAAIPQGSSQAAIATPSNLGARSGDEDRRRLPMASRRQKASERRSSAKRGYPRFFRRGNELVKAGWSKRAREEYQHKVPGRVLPVVAEAISRAGSNGTLIGTDQFLPLTDPETKLELPEYQVYVVLGWLRSVGLVTKHGRQGYAVAQPIELVTAVRSRWETFRRDSIPP